MSLHTLKIGDLIVRTKGPFSTHYLVYVGIKNGIRIVAENQSGIGVRYTSLETALAGNPIKRFEPFGGTEAERSLVVPKINSLLGKAYDLVKFNCEHFARSIANGVVESKQVRNAATISVGVGAVAFISAAASKNRNLAIFGVLALFIGVLVHAVQKSHESKRH